MVYRITLLFLITSCILSAQTIIKLPFERISKNSGLSQQTVNSVVQDKNGYLWFATQDGLNKYDGYEIQIFNHNPADKNSLSSNLVENLCVSKNKDVNVLWVGTENGLNKFNTEEGTSKRFFHKPNNPKSICSNTITNLLVDSRNNLWIGTVNGLSKFNIETETAENYKHVPSDKTTICDNRITSIVEAPENSGIIWFGTQKGMSRYDPVNNSFSSYYHISNKANSLLNDYINKIEYCKNGSILIGTAEGLSVFDIAKNSFNNFYNISKTNIAIGNLRAICQSSIRPNMVWIGTYDNLFVYDLTKNTFSQIVQTDKLTESPSYILNIFEDKFGLIWVGTYSQGLFKLIPKHLDFYHYAKTLNFSTFPNNMGIWSFYKSLNNIFWIGSNDGLYKIDMNTGKRKIYAMNFSKGKRNERPRVRTINEEADSKGNILWLGIPGTGIVKFDVQKETSQIYSLCISGENSAIQNNLYTVIDDKAGKFWIGRNNCGLCELDKGSGRIKYYNYLPLNKLLSQWITTIHLSADGSLWLGTYSNGLLKFNTKTKKYAALYDTTNSKIISNSILSLYEANNGVLWIGTNGSGLNMFDVKQNKFISYTTNDGLPNNVIYSILNDNSGCLWLSTNNGLSRFNPITKTFTNYNSFDGLQGNEFNLGACFKSKEGELFFGGTNGFNSFKPEFLSNSIPPITLVNSLKINGLKYSSEKSLDQISKIELKYYQNSLSFGLIGLHFQHPQKNKYRYMLMGYDEKWNYVSKPYEANYSNLSAGTYVFKAQSANCSGMWDNTGKIITIIIPEPFWKTLWFYALVFLLVILVIYFIVKARVMLKLKIQQARLTEREELRAKIAADFHDELGYTTTQISLLTSVLKEELNERSSTVEGYLSKISENSNTLFEKMKDFNWELDPNKDTLFHLAVHLKNFSDKLFDSTDIAFELNGNLSEFEKIKLPLLYRQHLLRIYKEGMHNILKHAEGCTNVALNISLTAEGIRFQLINNGKEFDVEKEYSGNGLTNMRRRAEKLEAVLEIKSGKNSGTQINLETKLPLK